MTIVTEVWKSSRQPKPWHRIDNTEDLRGWVRELAGQVPAAKAAVTQPIPVKPVPGQDWPCGMRGHCREDRR